MRLVNKLATGLGVLAISIAVIGGFPYLSYDWVAVSEPINLDSGAKYRFSFVSQKTVPYELELATDRVLDLDEQNCRLGIGIVENRCERFPRTLTVRWFVREGSKQIASGNSTQISGGHWGPTIGFLLGRFDTIRDAEYTIDIIVDQGDELLNPANPVIRVSIDGIEHKRAFVYSSLFLLVARFLLGLALLTWILGVAYRWWAARSARSAKME